MGVAEFTTTIEAARAQAREQGLERDWATWCPWCLQAWPGHVTPEGHVWYVGNPLGIPKHAVEYLDFNSLPPPDEACHCCDEWRPHGPGQEHFGYTWWRNEGPVCDHDHHRSEVWFA